MNLRSLGRFPSHLTVLALHISDRRSHLDPTGTQLAPARAGFITQHVYVRAQSELDESPVADSTELPQVKAPATLASSAQPIRATQEAFEYLAPGPFPGENPPAPKVLGRDRPDGTRKRLQVYLGGGRAIDGWRRFCGTTSCACR